ncbi:hypothetical protein LAZ67_X001769 [Cordylochernes scorpioides]|uniref:Uncharacterized protein n=1 Tax=Cordylochernes scorpioides TaxID=51811 RepID=A0ABY6LTV6_9ARAC|nr:hypothetical protein LAZ67_X001769 [Cordylochernes scorpioides]
MQIRSKCENDIGTYSRGIRPILAAIFHHGRDMDPPLHFRNQTAVETVAVRGWFSSEEREVDRICRKGRGQYALECQRDPGNAPTQKIVLPLGKLRDLRYDLLGIPRYSPDLIPSDFHLFPHA